MLSPKKLGARFALPCDKPGDRISVWHAYHSLKSNGIPPTIDSVDAFRRGFAEAVDAYLDTL